jgi:hypothetical protein
VFIYPMWDHESQRIGKQKCTPRGYALHGIAELFGVSGLLLLIGLPVYLILEAVAGSFVRSMLWLLVLPLGFALVGQALYQFSWLLASRKAFSYDYDKHEASWLENGERVTYIWQPDHKNPK